MQKEKTILFLHGFYASGQCVPAVALREAFEKKANVLTPDLPLHPHDAIRLIREICDKEKPDVLVGNSCGSFYAQMISPIVGIPALLGNPHFKMSDFLRERIGSHQYKSPRTDGKQDFTIGEHLISEFEELEAHQFDCCNIYNKDRVWGLFGEEDTLAHFEPLFLKQPELSANEVAVRFLSRNRTLRIMPVDERINKRIEEYGEFAGEGFLAQDGFCFKLSGEETISGEDPVRISFFTTFMPLSEMSDVQREAIFEECMKDLENLDR